MSIFNNVVTKEKANKNPSAKMMVIYGEAGCGKTTFCATAPKPFFMNLEDGMTSLNVTGNMPDSTPVLNTLADLHAWLDGMMNSELKELGYRTLVLDSLTKLDHLVLEDVLTKNRAKSVGDIPHGRGWAAWSDGHTDVYKKLDRIRKSGIGVMLIAHSAFNQKTEKHEISFKYHMPYYAFSDLIGYMNKGKLVVVESDKYQSKNRCGINELIKINLNEHWTKSQFFNSIDFYKQKIDQQTKPQTTGE